MLDILFLIDTPPPQGHEFFSPPPNKIPKQVM